LFNLTEDRAVIDGRSTDGSVCRLFNGLWWSDIAQPVTAAKQLLLIGGDLGLCPLAEIRTQVNICFYCESECSAYRAQYCFTSSVYLSVCLSCASTVSLKTNGHIVILFDVLVGASF